AFEDFFVPLVYGRLRIEWERCASCQDVSGALALLRAELSYLLANLTPAADPEGALLLRQALAADPGHTGARYRLGEVLGAQGDPEVITVWQEGLLLQPFEFEWRRRLVTMLLNSGQLKDADHNLTEVERILQAAPSYAKTWQNSFATLRRQWRDEAY